MQRMFACRRAGFELFDDASFRSRNSIDLSVSPQQVWDVLADVDSWPHWNRLITKLTWTSPAPHRAGSTRALELIADLRATEEVLVWNPYSHMAFRLIESSRPNTGASAEEFRLETTERGCRLTWSTAREPRKPPSWLLRMYAKPVVKRATRRNTKRLGKYIEGRVGPPIHSTG